MYRLTVSAGIVDAPDLGDGGATDETENSRFRADVAAGAWISRVVGLLCGSLSLWATLIRPTAIVRTRTQPFLQLIRMPRRRMRTALQPIAIVMTMNIILSGIEMMTNVTCHRSERPESHILEHGCIMTTMTSSFREN